MFKAPKLLYSLNAKMHNTSLNMRTDDVFRWFLETDKKKKTTDTRVI